MYTSFMFTSFVAMLHAARHLPLFGGLHCSINLSGEPAAGVGLHRAQAGSLPLSIACRARLKSRVA